jgi:glycosyltransferase involved in cell wall biosynthesis
MKILYYSPHPYLQLNAPTGYGTHIREMISAWKMMGVEVKTLIAGDLNNSDSNPYSAAGEGPVKHNPVKKIIPSLAWQSLRDLSLVKKDYALERELRQVISEFQPDYIYERVAYLQNSGIKIARRMKVPHIAEINAPFPQERVGFSGKSLLLDTAQNVEREFLVHSHGISVVSSALRDYLEKKAAGSEEKIRVVPNAVNPQNIEQTKPGRQVREELGMQNETVVGFVGSIFPYHGVDILIKAFAKLTHLEKVKLLIVGDGSVLPELKALAKKLQVLDKIIFTGSVPHREVYDFIGIMDICCMAASNWYGSPVKIFEYGLLEKPVIAPDVSPVRDVMDEECGMIVKPSEEDFSVALQKLLGDKALRDRLASNWHRRVMDEYTWQRAALKTLELCT